MVGAVYILFLTMSGTVSGVQKISMSEGGLSTHVTLGYSDRFGRSVTSIRSRANHRRAISN